MEQQNYEFTEEQNRILHVLAIRMKYVGLIFMFIGVMMGNLAALTIVRYPLMGVSFLLQTLLAIFVGFWTNQASYSFKLIVQTVGQDVDHLMNAVSALRRLYNLQFWLMTAVGILILITVVMSLTGGVSRGFTSDTSGKLTVQPPTTTTQ